MKHIALPALLLLAFSSPSFAEDGSETNTFRNNTGKMSYGIVRTLPRELRKEFAKKITKQYHDDWHRDMKKLHIQMKAFSQRLAAETKKRNPNYSSLDREMKAIQAIIAENTQRGMDRARATFLQVLAEAPLETRREISEELREELSEWEDYKIRPKSWWQFWR